MSGFYESEKKRKYQEMMSEIYPKDFKVTDVTSKETADEFSLEPISFEEAAENLCRDAETLFKMTVSKNRLSEIFLETTRTLEKVIRKLGSCCVTKAVLEAKGKELPALDGLDIEKLYCLASFNIRKCHASIRDGISKIKKFNIAMLDAECSWFTTLEQLKATEVRICLIREGKINLDDLIRRTETLGGGKRNDPGMRTQKAAAARKAASFPILRSVLEEYELSASDLRTTDPAISGTVSEAGIFRAPRAFSPESPAQAMQSMLKARKKREAAAMLKAAEQKAGGDADSDPDKETEAETEKYARKVWDAHFGEKKTEPASVPGLVRHENGTRKKKKKKKR